MFTPADRDGLLRARAGAVAVALLLCAPLPARAQTTSGQTGGSLAARALADPAFAWFDADAGSLELHFPAGSYAAANRSRLTASTESAWRHDLALLGGARSSEPIDVFFVESREQMEALVGSPVTGFADRRGSAVFLVANEDWRSFERHELMHVLAYRAWGPSSGAWIEEGLSQFADGRCGGFGVDAVAAALGMESGYVPLDTLTARFRELDDLSAYLQAASLVGYLYDASGRNAVRAVWQRGLGALPDATGGDATALEEAWCAWIGHFDPSIPAETLGRIRERGCG